MHKYVQKFGESEPQILHWPNGKITFLTGPCDTLWTLVTRNPWNLRTLDMMGNFFQQVPDKKSHSNRKCTFCMDMKIFLVSPKWNFTIDQKIKIGIRSSCHDDQWTSSECSYYSILNVWFLVKKIFLSLVIFHSVNMLFGRSGVYLVNCVGDLRQNSTTRFG